MRSSSLFACQCSIIPCSTFPSALFLKSLEKGDRSISFGHILAHSVTEVFPPSVLFLIPIPLKNFYYSLVPGPFRNLEATVW